MILHTQDRPFKCSFCDEYFKSRFARLKHQEKYHLGEKCATKINSKNESLLLLMETLFNNSEDKICGIFASVQPILNGQAVIKSNVICVNGLR